MGDWHPGIERMTVGKNHKIITKKIGEIDV